MREAFTSLAFGIRSLLRILGVAMRLLTTLRNSDAKALTRTDGAWRSLQGLFFFLGGHRAVEQTFSQQPYPLRHLTDAEIEEICLSRTEWAAEDWREEHLLLCEECVERAKLELEFVRVLRAALQPLAR